MDEFIPIEIYVLARAGRARPADTDQSNGYECGNEPIFERR